MNLTRELSVSQALAKEAAALQMTHWRNPLAVEFKNDRSPVTLVDKQCEALIRQGLFDAFPDDGFLGEESSATKGSSGRRWIVDPLDGTRPFLRGLPTFSVLIALEELGGELLLGVIELPALNESLWATRGTGAFCNGQSVHVSKVKDFGAVMGSGLGFIQRAATPEGRALSALLQAWNYTYGFMDAYTYASIANGRIDACVSLLDKPWDCAAACCIVKEAGGQYSDLQGNASVHNGSIVISNSLLHGQILETLQSAQV